MPEPARAPLRHAGALPSNLTDAARHSYRSADAVVRAGATVTAGRVDRRWRAPGPPAALRAPCPKAFVVGCPRSGTTWAAEILGRHPDVVTGRESSLYPTMHKSFDGRGRSSVRAWARLFYALRRGRDLGRPVGLHHWIDEPTLGRLGRDVVARDGRDDHVVGEVARGVLDSYFARAGGTARVLVEKTPMHVFHIEEILTDFPEARVVEVIRDGRDVSVSMAMRGSRVSAFPTTSETRMRMWANAVRAGRRASADPMFRDRITVVRYEDLKVDTANEIARLFAALGLESSRELAQDVAAASDIRHYPIGAGEFRHRGEAGTWVEHLSADDQELFRATVGDLFEEVGYSF